MLQEQKFAFKWDLTPFDQGMLGFLTTWEALNSYSRGTYVQTGFGPPDVTVPMFRIVTNEITIKGGWRYGSGD